MKTSEGMINDLLNLLAFIRPEGTDIGKGEDALTVQAVPNATSSPAPWILGTSSYSAQMAAELGVSEMMINPVTAAYASQPANRAPNREFTLRALAERLL